jgi:hypothetical protein
MKYVLLIHQGTTPIPRTPEWDSFSQEEQGGRLAQPADETPKRCRR